MKLYSLLILNTIQKRKKNNVKAPKKTKLALFPICILSCKQVCLHHTAHQTRDTDHRRWHDQSNHMITSSTIERLNKTTFLEKMLNMQP